MDWSEWRTEWGTLHFSGVLTRKSMDIRHVFEKLSQQSLENKTLLSNVQTIIDENIEVKDEDLGSILNWLELLKEMTVQVLQLTGNFGHD